MDIKDLEGKDLVIGKKYGIPNCPNIFTCVSIENNLNRIMFIREHDSMEHFGREFIEFKDGKPYFNIEEIPVQ